MSGGEEGRRRGPGPEVGWFAVDRLSRGCGGEHRVGQAEHVHSILMAGEGLQADAPHQVPNASSSILLEGEVNE